MTDRFALRVSAFYAAFFLFGGISLPFLPVWLGTRGLDAGQIGVVLATPLVVRLLVVPLSTRLADRFLISRGALIATTTASVAGFALLGVSASFPALLGAMAIASVASTPILPLADAYALRGLAERRRAYGPVRLWGSVSFIVANLGGGLVLEAAGAPNVIWALVAAQVLMAASTLGLPPAAPDHPASTSAHKAGASPWRSPAFLGVVAAASLIQASHAALYGFGTLQWTERGLQGPTIGLLWGIGVVAEIGLFAVSGRLVPMIGAIEMIVLGALGGVIRWGTMAFDPPALSLPFLQCLHALSFGATHLGTMAVLTRFAPRGRGATAQGDFSAVAGIAFAAAMSLSGVLVERFGIAAYAAMALMAALGGVIALTVRRCWRAADPV